jgi:adenylosuccinate synthase
MPVSIVVGGQYGSEGKGKVAHYFARERQAGAVVRVGGPNSGHTVFSDEGERFIFQQLPTAAVLEQPVCVIAAGSYLDLARLQSEIAQTRLPSSRLKIDSHAVVITEQHRVSEHLVGLRDGIGSTLTGTGAAHLARLSRVGPIRFAKDEPALAPYIADTRQYLRELLRARSRVVIEGTQGFGLSIFHGGSYPYATSRDTTAAGFLSEAGLSPMDVDEVVLVIRAFPIRVPGNSGPLPLECTWDDVTASAGSLSRIEEITSVTKSIRRVANFSPEVVREAIAANSPTTIVLNHVDYWGGAVGASGILPGTVADRLATLEEEIGRRVDLIGTSGNALWPRSALLSRAA